MKTPRISEATIQKAILQYLAAEHVFAIRMNSGVHFSESKGKRYMTRLAAPGTADILAFPKCCCIKPPQTCWHPSILWLEVKAADGKQTDVQKSFQSQVEAEGHRYAVVRSIEDVKAILGK